MAIDFSAILKKQAVEIEKPKPLPVGTYLCVTNKLAEFKEIGQNKTPCGELSFIVSQATDDVDPDALREFGEFKGKTIRHRLFLTETSLFRSKEELVNAWGLDEEGKALGQLFSEIINQPVYVKIKHTPTADGTDVFAEVEALAKV